MQFTQHVTEMYVKMVEPADNMYCRMSVNVLQDSLECSARIVSILILLTSQ